MIVELEAGWAFPVTSPSSKAHYFPAGTVTSLCGAWTDDKPRKDDGIDRSPDDCATCRNRLRALREAAELGLGFTAWDKPIKPFVGRRHYNDPAHRDTKPKLHAFAHRGDPADEGGVFEVHTKCGYVLRDMSDLRWTTRKPRLTDFCSKCEQKIIDERES